MAHLPLTATALDPARLNPFREVDPVRAAEEKRIKEFIAGRALAALGQSGGRPRRRNGKGG